MIHMFVFRWKSAATAAQKERAIRDIRAFEGVVPGLSEVHVGRNRSPNGAGYDTGGVMKFIDEQAMQAYFVHPDHQALLAWLAPLVEPIEADIEG